MKRKLTCIILSALLVSIPIANVSATEQAQSSTAVTAFAAGNTISEATEIEYNNGSIYSSTLEKDTNKEDYYTLELTESGKLTINIQPYDIEVLYYELYDTNAEKLDSGSLWDYSSSSISYDLTAGIYYLRFYPYDYGSDDMLEGSYEFQIGFTSANESFAETTYSKNNTYATASKINLNTLYIGQIAKNDSVDYYKFTLSEPETIYFNLKHLTFNWSYFVIYNEGGSMIDEYELWYGNEISGREIGELPAGTYYLVINSPENYTGNYSFSITTKSADESITVGKTKISSVKAKKKKLTVKWSPVTNATKYQVQYRIKGKKKWKTVATKSTSKTIKKLKSGKKYQVRVRAVNGSTKGKWSKIKTIKVK